MHPTKYYCTVSYSQKYYYIIVIYNNTYSAGMKERCRDGCRTSLLIAGVVLVPNIFHTLLPPCHPYITIHFMEMIFSTCTSWVELTEDKKVKFFKTNTESHSRSESQTMQIGKMATGRNAGSLLR